MHKRTLSRRTMKTPSAASTLIRYRISLFISWLIGIFSALAFVTITGEVIRATGMMTFPMILILAVCAVKTGRKIARLRFFAAGLLFGLLSYSIAKQFLLVGLFFWPTLIITALVVAVNWQEYPESK